jgi:putative membrane protein insertion efficiency factor|tara:strand:+ start:871 stop:1272 length:402 start_codon:yes stop_codon:yes gene_type:complete
MTIYARTMLWLASLAWGLVRGLERLLVFLLVVLVQVYRYALSPLLPKNCRYEPSCSAYALTALRRHGPLKGGWLAVSRIFRCHPWGRWGYDPVPPVSSSRQGPVSGSVSAPQQSADKTARDRKHRSACCGTHP